jgi:hypothetical protein
MKSRMGYIIFIYSYIKYTLKIANTQLTETKNTPKILHMYAAHVILISEEHREIEQATPMSLYPRVYYSRFSMVLKVMSTERSDM